MIKIASRTIAVLALASGAALVTPALHAQQIGVTPNHWAASSILELTKRGILQATKPAQKSSASTGDKPKRPTTPTLNGDAPVTRYEMVVTLWRFVQYIEAADKQKKGSLSVQVSPKEAIAKLVAGGYISKDSPLAKADATKVTTKQFTVAMGQVVARIQEKKTPISPDSRHAQ
jgi:hypothetical protein